MKFIILLFSLFGSISIKNIAAQDVETFAKKKEISTAHLKNTSITIDNKVFDYRILKHYSEEQLRNMSSVKRNQIHFIYTESYLVTDLDNCPSIKLTDIDVAKLGIYRKETASSIVEVGDQCKVHVELISRQDLQKKLDELIK